MPNPLPISTYLSLGKHLHSLCKPENSTGMLYAEDAAHLPELLQECGFRSAHATAKELDSLARNVSKSLELIPNLTATSIELQTAARQVCNVVYQDAKQTQTIRLKTSDVSGRLRELTNTLNLTDTQKTLLAETVRCIECEAYRAGVVMGWNLAYDYIRKWVFDKHLPAFNNVLTSRFNGEHPNDIVEYQEFFTRKALPEFRVLYVCKEANIFGGNLHDDLCQYLRLRNNYAHPNFTTPTVYTTNAYIEHLINIISSSPFNSINTS